MKVKVTWERVFDSDEFYEDIPFEELKFLNVDLEGFSEGILDFLEDNPYEIISEMKTELIEE